MGIQIAPRRLNNYIGSKAIQSMIRSESWGSVVMSECDLSDTRQMGISHKDFFRLLPRAMGNNSYELNGHCVRATLATGTVKITLGEEQERRLSENVIMPYTDVTFDYHGVPVDVRSEFERYFHIRFMRGLG